MPLTHDPAEVAFAPGLSALIACKSPLERDQEGISAEPVQAGYHPWNPLRDRKYGEYSHGCTGIPIRKTKHKVDEHP